MGSQIALFDAYRTLGHAAISGSYAAVGSQFTHLMRLICITNNTDGDMIFSVDGTTAQLFVAAASYKSFDFTTNKELSNPFYLPANTQFYVKQSTAPTKGDVYIEAVYGQGE
jgi:hypothetical protein